MCYKGLKDESYIYVYIYVYLSIFRLFPTVVYYKILSIVPCAIQ